MKMEKGKGQMKDTGFSRPYGPFSAKDAKKIADAIEKESTKKPAAPVKSKTVKPGGKPTKADVDKLMPKGPAKPNTMKKAPATGMKTTVKKAAAKPTAKAPAKTTTKAPAKKPAPLKGPAAIKELQRQVSKSGVKKAEEGAKKGLDKKYPGLYKK